MGKEQNTLAYVLKACKKYKVDTFQMFARGCEYCSKYGKDKNGNGKIYSVSGNSDKYPSMMIIPSNLVVGRCPCCDRPISFSTYHPELDDLDAPLSDDEIKELDRQRGLKKSSENRPLISLTCPTCGGQLEVSSTEIKTKCLYCGTQILIKDFITERRIDKADRIKALSDMAKNAVCNNDYTKAYDYYEEICKLDSSKENLARFNLYGFIIGKLNFNYAMLDDLYMLTPSDHRAMLDEILGIVNSRKQHELNSIAKNISENQQKRECSRIMNNYAPLIQRINLEISRMKQKRCKCGYMIEYDENVCPNCGTNYADYQSEMAKNRQALKRKRIKLGIAISIPVIIFAIIFSFVYNSVRVDNIRTAINDKNYTSAEQMINEYKNSNPSRVDVYELYADLYIAQNKPEKAIEILELGISQVNSQDKDKLQNEINSIKSKYNLK